MEPHSCCGTTHWPQHTSACMSQTVSVSLFRLWDKLWSHITGKPVTDAIKHADAQLRAFNVPKFPWRRCKHFCGQADWKVSLALAGGSRAFIDENASDGRRNRRAVVFHNDLLFPTRSIPRCQHFPATVAAEDDNKQWGNLNWSAA